jgi:hypothetical protein
MLRAPTYYCFAECVFHLILLRVFRRARLFLVNCCLTEMRLNRFTAIVNSQTKKDLTIFQAGK